MTSTRVGASLGIAVLLVFAGCAEVAEVKESAAAAPEPAPEEPAFTVPTGGPVDHADLRRRFGEPNTNIVYNPRAFDVYATASRKTVKILPDSLVFARADSAWLLQRSPGDTLYCSFECGADGVSFVRLIRSIVPDGDSLTVTTDRGEITDIIRSGWLHAEVPAMLVDAGGMGGGESKNGDTKTPEKRVEKDWGVGITGHVTGGLKFNLTVECDLVIDPGGFKDWSFRFPHIELFSFVLKGGPEVFLNTEVGASISGGAVAHIFDTKPYKLFTFMLGPVPVVGNISFALDASASVEGAVSYKTETKAGLTYTAGVMFHWDLHPQWTSFSNGPDRYAESTSTFTGEAGFKVVLEPKVKLDFLVLDAGGPYIELGGEAGVVGKIQYEKKTGKPCETSIIIEPVLGFDVSLGAEVCVPLTNACYPPKEKPFKVSVAGGEVEWDKLQWKKVLKKLSCEEGDAGVAGCGAGETMCSKACKNLQIDPLNCGSCGYACTVKTGYKSSNCSAGKCSCKCSDGKVCPGATTTSCPCPIAGQQNCGSGCIDLKSDPNNCGSCRHKCVNATGDATSTCLNGACSCACADGSACPDGKNTASCPSTCKCADGSACPGGNAANCPCPSGQTRCTTACVDLQTDNNDCGSCGTKCLIKSGGDPNSTCSGGQCSCTCGDGSTCPGGDYARCCNGLTDCGSGACVDLETDPGNCGQCGFSCLVYTGLPESQCNGGGKCSCNCVYDGRPCPDGTWFSCNE